MGRAALPLSGSMQSGGSPKWEGQRSLYLGLCKREALVNGKGCAASIGVYAKCAPPSNGKGSVPSTWVCVKGRLF